MAKLRGELEKEQKRSQKLEALLESMRNSPYEENGYGNSHEIGQKMEGSGNGPVEDCSVERDPLRQRIRDLEGQLSVQQQEASVIRELLEEEKASNASYRLDAEKRLAQVQDEKQYLDTQYKTLLGRVASIKSTLGERLKSDAVSKPPTSAGGEVNSPFYRKNWTVVEVWLKA